MIEGGIIDGIGMKLALDPLIEPLTANAFQIAGTRPVAEAVQSMEYGFVLGKFGDRKLALEGFAQFLRLRRSRIVIRECQSRGGRGSVASVRHQNRHASASQKSA